ncbi:MAG TPA: cytochrome c [Roseiarcus sp.]|nr:cytochrome c [Roseiarcus sp.]
MRRYAFATALVLAAAALAVPPARADDAQIARGKYLVIIAGCSDCHTPGALLGMPDMKRYLGGSDVGFSIPGLGVSVGENLTPDKETGLGAWTSEQIIAAIRTGKTPEGRDLSPVMPFAAFSHLTDADAQAIAAFLESLPPVSNKVRNFGPKEPVTVSVSAILPPAVYNALPAQK